MINLIEIAHLGQERMNKYSEYAKGVHSVMNTLPKTYDGSIDDCIRYFSDKIYNVTVNMLIHMEHNNDRVQIDVGEIALYSKMVDVLCELKKQQ
jgi:hypothetical protein